MQNKIEESEKQIKMLNSELAEQNTKSQELEMTVKKMKDSKEAAEKEYQRTLDQHQVILQYLCVYSYLHVCLVNASFHYSMFALRVQLYMVQENTLK